jgi:hypothetical protein
MGSKSGGLNKGQKIHVKELTIPITVKVGKNTFVSSIEKAFDVIMAPEYVS